MAKKPTTVLIENMNLGGIADSIYQGIANSIAQSVGFDHHSIPGVALVNQKMTIEPGAPTDDLYKILPCSDGNIYLFGLTNGHVWKNASGTYTNLGTVAPAAGAVGILDAAEYNGKIYYAMQNRLGSWDFTLAFAARNDNFATFTNGNATFHPIIFVPNQQVIYIGDGNLLAQVSSSGAFVANALSTIATNLVVTSLGYQGSDVLIGASTSNQVAISFVLRWNGWSTNVTTAYIIREPGINAFMPSEDEVIVNAGLSGNMYHLNGSIFEIVKQVIPLFPSTYSPSNKVTVKYPATGNKQGIPLFGLSNVAGNVALQGIYSYGRRSPSYPKILALEFPVSTGNLANITIWSIAVVGNDVYVSSKDTTSGTTYQIDKLDWSNKYSGAYFETRVIKATHVFLETWEKFIVNYAQNMPAGCSIQMFYSINGAPYVQFSNISDIVVDTDRNEATADRQILAKNLQFKVQITAVGNTAPIIEDVVILEKIQ